MTSAAHHAAGTGPHHLMLGTDVTSRLLGGDETQEELALIEATAPPGGGPGLHVDPWRESFYILDGELTFEVHDDAGSHQFAARQGDAVSIPRGAGHAFKVSGTDRARWLVFSGPAGLERFFADAGEPLAEPVPPSEPHAPDRDRLLAAFAANGLQPFTPGRSSGTPADAPPGSTSASSAAQAARAG
jgi:quercetin dioxygenase-like cupin family protein